MNRHGKLLIAVGLLAASLAVAATSHAHDPIVWRTFDSGGVSYSSAGNYRLGASIGQYDAGSVAAGAFTLRGGFWIGGSGGSVSVEESPAHLLPFRLFQTAPNPVRSRSRLAFQLPRASRVELSLFDVSGRTVQRWDFGLVPPGRQERTWTAVGEDGRPLASGVYFLRLDTDRERGVQKILVLR